MPEQTKKRQTLRILDMLRSRGVPPRSGEMTAVGPADEMEEVLPDGSVETGVLKYSLPDSGEADAIYGSLDKIRKKKLRGGGGGG